MRTTIGDFKKRRSWLKISVDILSLCLDGSKTTQAVYGSNIAFPRFRKYSQFLIEKKLLEVFDTEEGKIYQTTERGKRFLGLMKELTSLFDSDETELEALI